MPYTLKPSKVFVKDPNSTGYLPQNVITEESTQEQLSQIQSAGTTQVNTINTQGNAKVAAIETKGEEVLESIPDDYSALSGEVSDLKSAKVDKPLTLIPQEITINNGYYPSTGGYINTALYKCGEYAVTAGETLYLSGSGDTAKPAYIFTNSAKNSIISKAEEALEMSDYKITVPTGAGYVRLNSAGTNKTLAVKKASIDSDFDINDLVGTVDTLSTNMNGLQSDVDALESTSLVSKTAVSGTNFDSVDVNTVYDVNISTLIILSNKVPYNYFTGSIFTVGDSSGNMQQLAIGDNQTIYFRIKSNNSWSNWEQLDLFKIYTAQNWLNLNTAKQKNISIEFANAGTSSTHVPTYQFQGAVFNVNDTNYGGQIAIDKTGKVYGRGKNAATWGSWIELARADVVDSLTNEYPVLAEFGNITCIGDSLTYGSVYYAAGGNYRQAKKPYPEVLATLTGSNVTSVAQSGIDPVNFVQNLIETVTAKDNQLCIIYLGTNGGGLTDTIDTDAAGSDKSQYDTTTETGAYCYIVKHCLDIGSRVMLVKCYAASDTTNEVIGKIAEKFSVAVIENKILPAKYRYWLSGTGIDSLHYNDFGYAAFAKYLIRQVNQLSNTMLIRLFPYPISAT